MKTVLYQKVVNKQITNFQQVFSSPYPFLQAEIVDLLEVKYKVHVVSYRRVYKSTCSGRKPSVSLHVLITGSNYIGLGKGSAKTFIEAKLRAIRFAKLKLIPIRKNQIFNCNTVYKTTTGKVGSTVVKLEPVTRGTGLVCAPRVKQVLQQIENLEVRVIRRGSNNAMNFYSAIYEAFKQLWHIL